MIVATVQAREHHLEHLGRIGRRALPSHVLADRRTPATLGKGLEQLTHLNTRAGVQTTGRFIHNIRYLNLHFSCMEEVKGKREKVTYFSTLQ